MADWEERAHGAQARYEDGAARLPVEPDERQRQLTRMGNAAWAAGLSHLMLLEEDEANRWLTRAAETYRRSWADAPSGSWGRPIGAMKSRLIARDFVGARSDADWALEAGAAESESPIGRYAASLASLVIADDDAAAALAATLASADAIPPAVTMALSALASSDAVAYADAIHALAADFEARDAYLEDIPVADTVLALQVLAEARGMSEEIASPLLPSR
jgi:hypothetical protein